MAPPARATPLEVSAEEAAVPVDTDAPALTYGKLSQIWPIAETAIEVAPITVPDTVTKRPTRV